MAKITKDYFELNDNIKQNDINDILVSGEEILLSLKPDKKTSILESILKGLPLALIWGGFDAFFIIMMFTTGLGDTMGGFIIVFLVVFFAIHLIPVWKYIAGIIKTIAGYKNIVYVFTSKRIIIRTGLIGIDFKNIYYEEVQTVTVKVGLLDRIFKVGDLYIQTANQVGKIENIKAPYHYSSKIQKIVQDIKTDINFPNDLRPSENRGYNTKYIDDSKNKD